MHLGRHCRRSRPLWWKIGRFSVVFLRCMLEVYQTRIVMGRSACDGRYDYLRGVRMVGVFSLLGLPAIRLVTLCAFVEKSAELPTTY